jgi:hypothetical protein
MNKLAQFLKSGIKSLKRERYYALLNILGLGLGIFCFLLTSLYVKDELTHDKWHKNAENIYMPQRTLETPGGSMALLPAYPLGGALVEESPGVRDAVNISFAQVGKYTVKEEEFETKRLFNTTGSIFRVFDFGLELGDEEKALSQPDGVVISYELARKHFPGQNPMGELIDLEHQGTYKVTGVLKPIPGNSHLQFDFLIPIDYTKGHYINIENHWQFGMGVQYLLVEPGYDIEKLEQEASALIQKNTGKEDDFTFAFNKFSELYLSGKTSRSSGGMFGGQEKYIIIFSVVGTLMLFVASFNYINLTTSRSFARAKDFAVRKVVGASKGRLIAIQLGETFFVTFLALVVAIIGIELVLPGFNELIGKQLSLNISSDLTTLAIPAGVLVLVVFISGVYPALMGSRFNLSSILKGNLPNSKGSLVRKSLIVVQFVICTGVLASALIIRFQADYMISMDLGYNSQNIISIEMARAGMYSKKETFRTELSRSTLIEAVSSGPIPDTHSLVIIEIGEGEDMRREMFVTGNSIKGFVNIAGLELVAGSSFEDLPESALESAVILNETGVETLGLMAEEAIGQTVEGSSFRIVGVVKDFHISATKSKIKPLIISYNPDNVSNTLLRFKAGDQEKVIAFAESIWEELGATEPLKYDVIENHFDNAFKREEALISIFDGLTIMLISVAGLGLFALAVFESQIREKELCIRKVLGANYLTLLRNLNMRFVLLIGLALIISIPITQYLIGSWLDAFPYRIDSTANYFIIAGGLVMVLAIVMLSIQGVNSVRKNPAEVLRNE